MKLTDTRPIREELTAEKACLYGEFMRLSQEYLELGVRRAAIQCRMNSIDKALTALEQLDPEDK
jgi:chaperonin cofactor prefoldin